ncbi:hypothetical protein [Candidatus Williamhamiltonella defendens]|nr:hypothetical protein [Candidatus Hamiltonella defensa]
MIGALLGKALMAVGLFMGTVAKISKLISFVDKFIKGTAHERI